MTRSVADKRAAFAALHESGCFVLPNPWDVGSARLLQSLGFAAVATTSSGFAWTTGRPDYAVTRAGVLEHLQAMCAAIDLPVNADFESGFSAEAQGVAESVTMAIGTGVAGLSIEDRSVEAPFGLYDKARAAERVRAARAAIDRTKEKVILVARTEGLLSDPTRVTEAIDKLVAFAEAGADCLYAPGVKHKEDIAAMVRAVAPKPVNFLASINPSLSLAELEDLGVRRISVGGALARVAWRAIEEAAEEMRAGSFQGLTRSMPGDALNELFGRFGEA
ncbi:MAG TPA: isocitrate lyase/phosphoenolpyruvate mutase family protein [Polyangiaceae bacterium]|jgi:2-methylisocitrate lyase-like PEP mutase family enzyme